MPYAIFGFDTPNLGDDVQALAQALLLPSIDAYVDRDQLDRVKLPVPHHVIMNSWFAIKRHRAVPSDSIIPHYFGQCVGNSKILNPVWFGEWAKHAPIGCRDLYSVSMLQQQNIDAFYSGCLTTWMGRFFHQPKKREGIFFVDVPEEMEKFIPEAVRSKAKRITNFVKENSTDQIERFRKIAKICDVIRNAEAVVTRRLHTALPCVGFGTPISVYLEGSEKNRRRFSGADRFLPISFHDGHQIIEGEEWVAPTKVQVSADMETRFQELAAKFETAVEPRYHSVSEFVETLPHFQVEPRSFIRKLISLQV